MAFMMRCGNVQKKKRTAMKRLPALVLAVVLTLGMGGAANAGGWWCPTGAAWYPQVLTCPHWIEATPGSNLERAQRNIDEQAEQARQWERAKAAQEAERAEQAKRDAVILQQNAARQAAIQKRYEAAVAAQERRDKENGYNSISFEDFAVDGKSLAREETRVSITGIYKKEGQMEKLYSSMIGMLTTQGNPAGAGVDLMTENATRDTRKYLYNCQQSPVLNATGCQFTILGHATLCERTIFGVPTTVVPCIDVDYVWYINPNDPPATPTWSVPSSEQLNETIKRIYDRCNDPKNTYADCPPKRNATTAPPAQLSPGTTVPPRGDTVPPAAPQRSAALADDHGGMYQKGLDDRAAWEAWFNSLQGDYKTGAFYWASQRSLPDPGSCQQMNAEFTAGCAAAKSRLDPSDALRRSQADYKLGWNAWVPSYVPEPVAPVVAAPSPAVAAAPSAAPQSTPPAAVPSVAAAQSTDNPVEGKADTKSIDNLPDHTPNGVALEKKQFYLRYTMGMTMDLDAWLRVTDTAVAMARADGLRCDSVTKLEPWMFSKGFTLQCNNFDYKYYLEDKGRGYQIRIAD
jgi:hypothetical protein